MLTLGLSSHVYSLFVFIAIQSLQFHCFNLDVNHTIIYENPSKNAGTRSSYFGFSVLLYSGSDRTSPWIQIGAPRGNDPLFKGVREPGVVYRCPILDTCKSVALDNKEIKLTETKGRSRKTYTDDKNGAWIGGAMDIDEKNGKVVVCGHRWGYERREDQFSYMLGICYSSNVNQSISDSSRVTKLMPLHKPDYYFLANGNNPYYLLNYGVGQAGISVHIPKDQSNSDLLIGAPGVLNWKGSAALYKDVDNIKNNNYAFPKILDPKSASFQQYTLFGYQVNSGKFDNSSRYYYVVGNPKGTNKGKVLIYTYRSNYDINVVKWLDGYQIGEYFGSSLAVADVDCDGIDDLVVGAPLYTVNHDEGRIYIFLSNSQNTVFKNPIIITGKIVGGRFGTSVTALGDLDKDGCDDIAVGAPYVNGNRGAVYIYSGNKESRGPVLSQEINANDIHPQLKGFGFSISRGADIDNNGYPDVAVGAYMSDQTVIFRAQPVITLSTKIAETGIELQRDTTSFVITVCLSYKGTSEHIPATLHVLRNITVDEKLGRAHFFNKKNVLSEPVVIPNRNDCQSIEVFLMKMALEENTSDPVSVKVTQEIINSGGKETTVVIGTDSNIKSNDGFRKDFPVVNRGRSIQTAVVNIPFASECNDTKCEAELQLNCSFSGIKNGVYVIGSKSKLQLEVNVTNKRQPAYMTVVNIKIPLPIQLSIGHKNCKEQFKYNSLLLVCNFGNPLRNGTLKNLTLDLDTSEVRPGSKNLTFFISVSTSSEDKNKAHNSKNLDLNFVVDADMIILGKSDELVYNYAKTNKTVFKQRYEVQKKGLSQIEEVEIELDVPIRMTGPNGKTF